MSIKGFRSALRPLAIIASAGALLLAGCGTGDNVNPPVGGDATGMSGIAHGGPNPVVGATVTLYATTSSGYGAAATKLGTATTGSNGGFSFSSPATCTAGQQAYITVSGGNPGSGTNNSYLLMAALGDCSTISSATTIWVDEVTTVAAAYALAPFITDTAGVVAVGAPAANNSESPSCTGTGSSMVCTAGGLKHAFQNALNLANSVSLSGVAPNGQAYQVTPSNSKGSVPQALINSVANSIESCVNSTGGTSGTTNCGKLFTAATPPTSGAVAPTDTLQALVNIAQYPTQNVATIFALAPATSFYQPQLAGAPSDLSLAIVYSGLTVSGTTSSFGGLYDIATDIADNVYADSYTSPTEYVTGMTSNATGLFSNTTSLASYTYARLLEPDTAGNLWVTQDASATNGGGAVLKLSTATGAQQTNGTFTASTYVDGVAIDRNNNVYYTVEVASADDLYAIAAGGTTATAVSAGATPTAVQETGEPEYIAIDGSGNLWNTEYSSSASDTYFLPNTGTIAAPAFGTGVTTVESSTIGNLQSIVFDNANHAWVNNYNTTSGDNLYELATPPATTPSQSLAITSSQSGTAVSAHEVFDMSIDGANNIFLPDYNAASSYLWEYLPAVSSSTFVYLKPCAAPAGATTCNSGTTAGTYAAIYAPEQTLVDSTGSVWVANHTSASITQVLGVGTPAWPQLSYGHTGEPQ